jgi:hypothetical protein
MEIIIYKLYCKNNEIKDCYIGSTGNIKTRIKEHKYSCNNENLKKYNQYKYVYIRENGGFDNWDFKILCKCPKDDRYKMERWYIENCKESNLNKSIPTRTHKEYYNKNKDKIKEKYKEYKKEYYQKNKEYKKEYREKNKEKKKEYHKEYREKNKEKIKEYYQKNKEKNKEKRKQKMTCICGSVFVIHTKSRHCRSLKHQTYMQNNQTI